MSKFTSFLRKFAPEMRSVGSALFALASGVALPRHEREQVENAATQFMEGANNIFASIEQMKDIEPQFTTKQLNDAVRKALPDIIGGLSEAALRKLLEQKTQKPAN